MSVIVVLALVAAPEAIFDCRIGNKQLTVARQGNALVYRYGSKRKTELRIVADAASQRVFYHRTLYPRGEDQTLRFVNGDYDYIVYAHWTAATGDALRPEVHYGGLIVLRGDDVISRRSCNGGGDMREWPIFLTLPQDARNLLPAQ